MLRLQATITKLHTALADQPKQALLHSPFDEEKLGKLLGKGALGRVYQARWRSCAVAVKGVESQSEAETKLLLNEINALRKVCCLFARCCELSHLFIVVVQASHPGVVRLLRVCAEPERMALIMEYLPGGDLKAAIDARKYGPSHIEVCALLCFRALACMLTCCAGVPARVSRDHIGVRVSAPQQRNHQPPRPQA